MVYEITAVSGLSRRIDRIEFDSIIWIEQSSVMKALTLSLVPL
jgi:hypothetical protein